MTHYFIRHGESTANADKTIAGRLDVALTQKGVAQALSLGQWIAERRITVDIIVASPLIRAYETAAIIAKEIGYPLEEIIVSDLLVERDFGDLQGESTIDEIASRAFRESLAAGVETEYTMTKRVDDALAFIGQVSSGTTLIVSHNGVGKRMIARVMNKPLSDIPKLPNAELIKLEAETSE